MASVYLFYGLSPSLGVVFEGDENLSVCEAAGTGMTFTRKEGGSAKGSLS